MATDYDAPRKTDEDSSTDSIEELKAHRSDKAASAIDAVDALEAADGSELPGADLSGEELTVAVQPMLNDEFTCANCFLVHHRSRLARLKNNQPICNDCD
ncbi:curli biogenesis system outer membrane secretion channel CsgG [Kitasatospora gansuensis]|uniref:Curli biogenesis system outer membrane secretion channel CsgG n=1 Tax=Kitasatospora gansuensis TaxID=258050 RepID=A0A7W7SK92_9ACTN|nr:DUF4193 domain-containing protein [Kitasatospora gansuensis]MBB4951887.1 curli biogenesis system outer membrane secretion channel CsgG [Kitasatospora gansuensis]